MDGTSFSDAGSLVTTAHLTREICPRDLKYRKNKTNMGDKTYYLPGVFFLSVRDWITTKVVLWASAVKQFSMRSRKTLFGAQCPKFKARVSSSVAINLVGDRDQ